MDPDPGSNRSDPVPAGLYVHLPFCASICPYCDFAVLPARPRCESRYLELLGVESALRAGEPYRFDTIYLGGGTPSAASAVGLHRLLDELRATLRFVSEPSIEFEANPEDVSRDALRSWRAAGVSRLVLGIQSLDDEMLRALGRRHDAATARDSVELAREEGFERISVELLYGLPGQSAQDWQRDLERVIALRPGHITCSQLTWQAGTPFERRRAAGELHGSDEMTVTGMFFQTHRQLAAAGWLAYELSHFATADPHRSSHNRKYWDHSPYLGLGIAAHSFRGNRRSWNPRDLDAWADRLEQGQLPVVRGETLSPDQLVLEALLLGLRTSDGVDLDRVRARWRVDLAASNRDWIEQLCERNLLVVRGNRLVPTLAGMAVADDLARGFRCDE